MEDTMEHDINIHRYIPALNRVFCDITSQSKNVLPGSTVVLPFIFHGFSHGFFGFGPPWKAQIFEVLALFEFHHLGDHQTIAQTFGGSPWRSHADETG